MEPIPFPQPFAPSPTPSVSTMPPAPKPKRTRQNVLIGILILVIAVGAYGYATGFSFGLSRFFASTTCPNEGQKFCSSGDLYRLDAAPSGYGCVQTKIEDCGTGTCVQSSSTDAHCQASPTPTPTPTPTATAGGCTAPAISGKSCHTDSKTNVTFCIQSDSTFESGTCTNANSGTLKQHVKIRNCSAYDGYIKSGGFNDPVAGCGATQTGGFTVGVTGGNIAKNQSGDVWFYVDAASCGRLQADACFQGDGFGGGPRGSACLDTDQWNILGKVINSGKNCPTPTPTRTPTPTPTGSVTPTPTPTPTEPPTPTPTTSKTPLAITCAPLHQTAQVGETVSFTGSGAVASTPYYWYAPGGTPDYLPGNPFAVSYATPGFKTVTVAWGGSQAACTVEITAPSVSVTPTPTETPTPTPSESVTPTPTETPTPTTTSSSGFTCTPASSTLYLNQSGAWNTHGGTAPFSWSAPSAATTSGTGTSFTTSYNKVGTYQITATDAAEHTAVCTVNVRRRGGGGGAPSLDIVKAVRSYPDGLESENVTVSPGSTVEFIVTVFNDGNRAATQVIVHDALPAGLTYVPGSTTIDNITPAADGITTTGLNIGDLAAGDSVGIRFRATVAPTSFFMLGTTILTDVATARASNAGEVSDTALVTVIKSAVVSVSPGPPVTNVPTGPGESTLLALIVSAIVTLLYIGYTSTDTFRRREVSRIAGTAHGDSDTLDFRR